MLCVLPKSFKSSSCLTIGVVSQMEYATDCLVI
jgi:hypothetical protein